jgi:hypothetical protein
MSKHLNKLFIGLALSYLTMTSYGVTAAELIDQAKVTASGGFPFRITKAGSYRLSSNLTVTGSRDGIYVEVSNVTVDLDGFVMVADTGGQFVAGTAISDHGHSVGAVVIRNGTMSNWGTNIDLALCSGCTIKDLVVRAGGSGISVGSSSVVSGNVLTGGDGTGQVGNGITAGAGSRITGNILTGWGQGMSAASNSLISGNTVYQNLYGGIFVSCPADLIGNISRDNPPNISKTGAGCTFFNDNAP